MSQRDGSVVQRARCPWRGLESVPGIHIRRLTLPVPPAPGGHLQACVRNHITTQVFCFVLYFLMVTIKFHTLLFGWEGFLQKICCVLGLEGCVAFG